MKRLQAAMRDRAARSWKQNRVMYRVGSYFKGCHNCGETIMVPWGNREVKRYLSGYHVFRAYCPKGTGWTYWCWTCGSKDLACWEGAEDIGEDAIRGARGAVAKHKALMRGKVSAEDRARIDEALAKVRKKKAVAELQAELDRLIEMVKNRR